VALRAGWFTLGSYWTISSWSVARFLSHFALSGTKFQLAFGTCSVKTSCDFFVNSVFLRTSHCKDAMFCSFLAWSLACGMTLLSGWTSHVSRSYPTIQQPSPHASSIDSFNAPSFQASFNLSTWMELFILEYLVLKRWFQFRVSLTFTA